MSIPSCYNGNGCLNNWCLLFKIFDDLVNGMSYRYISIRYIFIAERYDTVFSASLEIEVRHLSF